MTTKKKLRGNPIPLVVEEHPEGYKGYPFITLIQYRDQHILAIIDNVNDKMIKSFVLDLCGPEQVNEEHIIHIATSWYDNSRERYPISFEFSRLGISEQMKKIYRTFNVDFVARVIGPLPRFEMNKVQSIKRRRKKNVPVNLKIDSNILFK